MRALLYVTMLALSAGSCATARNYAMEDDIYYVPGKKALVVKEVEKITGEEYPQTSYQDDTYAYEANRSQGSSIAPKAFTEGRQQRINARGGSVENSDIASLTQQAQDALTRSDDVNEVIYENSGYWIGGYKGSERDFDEIQRIINMYPNGFAFFNSNGYDIAMNLSFDSDWNVYTDNGRYWWFPSNSNIDLYSSLLFGTYPKYIWTVVWDNPRFDNWAFNSTFNNHFNWGFNFNWGGPGWSIGFGWNSPWYAPWYRGWYDPWYDPWCRPWHGHWYDPWYGYHPHWGHGHWHDHWYDHYYPGWNRPGRPSHPLAGQRPNYGGGVNGIRPSGRPGYFPTRPTAGRRPSGSGAVRPSNGANYAPSRRPGNHDAVRPNGSTTRPGYNTGNMGRPNSTTRPATRPNTGNILRPGTSNRNNTTARPGSTTRPNSTTRPTTTKRPNTTTRPATQSTRRPNTTARPTQNYSRPNNTYRPTYNTNRSSRATYSPQRSSMGGGSHSGTGRPVRRR